MDFKPIVPEDSPTADAIANLRNQLISGEIIVDDCTGIIASDTKSQKSGNDSNSELEARLVDVDHPMCEDLTGLNKQSVKCDATNTNIDEAIIELRKQLEESGPCGYIGNSGTVLISNPQIQEEKLTSDSLYGSETTSKQDGVALKSDDLMCTFSLESGDSFKPVDPDIFSQIADRNSTETGLANRDGFGPVCSGKYDGQ